MTPGARMAAAIEVLEHVERDPAPADRILAAWGRGHRFAGAKDRAAIADHVYDMLRRRRSLAWAAGGEGPRHAAIGLCLVSGQDPDAVFTGAGHAPPPLTADERAALAAPRPPVPDPVRLDYPDWLDAALRSSLGDRFEPSMRAMQARAPVDLRVNALKADLGSARAALERDGVATETVPLAPMCLRAPPGAPVARTAAYRDGLVELQDAASQAAVDFAGVSPGDVVLDFCAGGGGKTLALAAAMEGRGRLVAHDASPRRMADLPARLARAGARAEIAGPEALERLRGRCDVVFIDAPCSGSGSWRRDPAGKWRLTAAALADVAAVQARILRSALAYLRPGGAAVYATCSMLSAENEAVVAKVSEARAVRMMSLAPSDGCGGFFAAMLARGD
jgi:16S rRNA (cytosine967-C5)-methyltransferase